MWLAEREIRNCALALKTLHFWGYLLKVMNGQHTRNTALGGSIH
jgi:hypothetical protein